MRTLTTLLALAIVTLLVVSRRDPLDDWRGQRDARREWFV